MAASDCGASQAEEGLLLRRGGARAAGDREDDSGAAVQARGQPRAAAVPLPAGAGTAATAAAPSAPSSLLQSRCCSAMAGAAVMALALLAADRMMLRSGVAVGFDTSLQLLTSGAPPRGAPGARPPNSAAEVAAMAAACSEWRAASIAAAAQRLYDNASDMVAAHAPHPHYLNAYRAEEWNYWGPQLPQWMLRHACERADAGVVSRRHLDVGIAYGTLALYLAAASAGVSAIYGVDPFPILSPTLAAAAHATRDVANAELVPLLPDFTDFDAIVLTEALEHLNFNPVPTLARLRQRMAPGAVLWLSTPHGGGPGHESIATWRDMPPPPQLQRGDPAPEFVDGHIYEYGPEELRDVLTEAGFVIDCADRNMENNGHLLVQAHAAIPGEAAAPLCARTTPPPYCACTF